MASPTPSSGERALKAPQHQTQDQYQLAEDEDDRDVEHRSGRAQDRDHRSRRSRSRTHLETRLCHHFQPPSIDLSVMGSQESARDDGMEKHRFFFEDLKGDPSMTKSISSPWKTSDHVPTINRQPMGESRRARDLSRSITTTGKTARGSLSARNLHLQDEVSSIFHVEQRNDSDPTAVGADFIPFSMHSAPEDEENSADENAGPSFLNEPHGSRGDDYIAPKIEIDYFRSEAAAKARDKHEDLERRTQTRPSDCEAWLEYAEFQYEWLRNNFGAGSVTTYTPNPRDVAESRIELLEVGLMNVKEAAGKQRLLVRLMEESEVRLARSELADKWEKVMAKYPQMAALRMLYLDYLERNRAGYQVEACHDQYKRLLKDTADPAESLTVFCRYTAFLRDAGFQELATASWQMLLEISLLPPSIDRSALQVSFETFWDAESPRIGEEAAKGWRNHSSADHAAPSILQEGQDTSNKIHTTWLGAESAASQRCTVPGKLSNGDGEDDPFSVVFFSDMEHLWEMCVQTHDSKAVIDSFLQFCGLPSIRRAESSLTLRGIHSKTPATSYDMAVDNIPLEQPLMDGDTLLGPDCKLFRSLVANAYPSPGFVGRALRVLVDNELLADDDDLAEYYLAVLCAMSAQKQVAGVPCFELCANHAPSARKAAKSLLKAKPTRMRLISAFGNIQVSDNPPKSWDSTLSNVLLTIEQFPPEDRDRVVILLRTRLWQAVFQGQGDPGKIILSIATGDAAYLGSNKADCSRMDIFKARDKLLQEDTAYTGDCTDAILARKETLALLTYYQYATGLERDGFTAAVGALRSAIQDLTDAAPAVRASPRHTERLHQTIAHLVTHHVTKHPRDPDAAAPKAARTALVAAATRYPSNLAIQLALAAVTPQTDRLRELIPAARAPDPLSAPASLAAHAVVIRRRMEQTRRLAGTAAGVRRAFERAVESAAGARCAALWAWWLRWEVAEARGGAVAGLAAAPRAVWLRGSQVLPGNKWWVLLGLELLGEEGAGGGEWEGWAETMAERGLRMHVDVHEFAQ